MKLVLYVGLGLAVTLLAWVYWPGSDSAAVTVAENRTAQLQKPQSPDSSLPPAAQPQIASGTAPNNQVQVCLSAAELGQSFQQLQHERVNRTNQLIDLHIRLGIKKPFTFAQLQAVGGDLEVFQFRQSARKSNYAHFHQTVQSIVVDANTMMSVQAAIAKQDYAQLLQFIQQHPAADRHRLFMQMEQSLLGRIIVANPQIQFSTIQQFIDAGIQPFIADLAAFTALDLPLPLIDMVQQHFKGDLHQPWPDNFRSYNLTLLAAENASAELFDYWRSLGIPASLQPYAPNAFDLIPLPGTEQELQRQLSKVRTLLASGMLPRAADVRRQWLLLLPEQESQQMSELLQQQPDLLFDHDGPDAAPLLALQQLQMEFNQLLHQVAACPKAQRWPIALATPRNIPERFYLKHLKQQQQAAQQIKEVSAEDINNAKQLTDLIQKKNWHGIQDLMQRLPGITAEDVSVDILMLMMILNADTDDLQQQLTNISQLSTEQIKRLSEVASPAHRELLKTAGFELPLNAEAAKRHQQLQELEQRRKKAEQRRSNLPQQ